VGDWLHRALETYRVPKRIVGQPTRDGERPRRLFPIFRDREELPASADLGSKINEALTQSRYLVVVCSRNSAKSVWVNEEIKFFKKLGREDRVFGLIVDGEPNASAQKRVSDRKTSVFPKRCGFGWILSGTCFLFEVNLLLAIPGKIRTAKRTPN
jgi:hypothetical protein